MLPNAAAAAPPVSIPASAPGGAAVRLGVVGAALVYAALSAIWVLSVPPFLPADESAHVDYGMQVTHGHLPFAGRVFTPEFPGQHAHPQHVANHPPLYYLVVGPILRVLHDAHHPTAAILLSRLVGAVLGLVIVVLAAVLAGQVTAGAADGVTRRTRTQLMVTAAGLVAGLPSLVAACGAVQNDSLAVVLDLAALVVLARAVRRGPTWGRVVALAGLSTAGMLARVSFLPVLLVVLVTLAVLRLQQRDRPLGRRCLDAGAAVAVVAGSVLAGAGWFYRLNHHRYGDFIGGSVIYRMVHTRTLLPGATSVPRFLVTPWEWWIQLAQLAGGSVVLAGDQPRSVVWGSVVVGAVLVVGVLAVLDGLRRGQRWRDRPGWLIAGGLFAVFVISYVEMADHVTNKGEPNNRYLLEAAGFWGVGLGAALLAVGRRRLPVAAPLMIVVEAAATLNFTAQIVFRQAELTRGRGHFDAVATSMAHVGVGHAGLVLGLLLALVGGGILAQTLALVALGHLRRRPGPAAVWNPVTQRTHRSAPRTTPAHRAR